MKLKKESRYLIMKVFLLCRELTEISVLKKFIHLRYVTLADNLIKDISPIGSLSNLLTLRAEQNQLNSAQMDELPYLQVLV